MTPVLAIGIGIIAIWGDRPSKSPQNYATLKVVDAFYYDPQSFNNVIKDPSIGPLIPTDPQSQHDFFRVMKYRYKPVLRIQISNSHPTLRLVIHGLFLRLDNQQYWWSVVTQIRMGESGRIEVPANTSIEVEGTPGEWPYAVDTGAKFEWAQTLTLDARSSFEAVNVLRNPKELWARLGASVSTANSSGEVFLVAPNGFRINKGDLRQYSQKEQKSQ